MSKDSTQPLPLIQKSQIKAHLITTDFPPSHGGLQTYAWKIANHLSGISLVSAGLGHGIGMESSNLPVGVQGLYHLSRSRLGAALWSTWDMLRHPSLDLVRLHMQWNTALWPWLQGRLGFRSRYIVLIHGAEIIEPRASIRWLMKAILEDARVVVAGSQFTAAFLISQGIKPKRLEVINYGTDLPLPVSTSSQNLPKTQPIVRLVCLHRLVARKGTALLLRSLAAIQGLPWQLTLAGEGPERSTLEALARDLKLESRLTFLGKVSDLEKQHLFRDADLFILPSLAPNQNDHLEGLGLGLLDAQAHGLPVLGARTGGIPEALLEGQTGWLFEAGSQTSLVQVLTECLNNPDALKIRGQAGCDFIQKNFLWDNNFKAWSRLFAELA
jgi:phosphatidyl-myo-inositol dimannoside synthase